MFLLKIFEILQKEVVFLYKADIVSNMRVKESMLVEINMIIIPMI